jgi:hypothetical protein
MSDSSPDDCFPHLPIRYSTKTRQVGLKTDTKIFDNFSPLQRNLFQAKFSLPLCRDGCLSGVAISMKFACIVSVAMLGELRLVEKEINGGNPAGPGNDEISTSVCWRLTRAARYPLDPPAIAHFLRLGYWLISRVSSLDLARDSIDLVAASVDTYLGIGEHASFGEDFVNCRAPPRRVVLTEDVVKIARQEVDML